MTKQRITTTTLVQVEDGYDTTVTLYGVGIIYSADWHFYTEEV